MKSLKIPDNQIYNAYLLTGEDSAVLEKAALDFAADLLRRDPLLDRARSGSTEPVWKNRGFASVEEWYASVEKRVREEEHPDLILIRPDKPEDNPRLVSVDNIRDHINDTVDIRPYEAEYKIYLVFSAEKMNAQAQNALLKTLEEPPEYVVILLLAANADAFLPTILSRVIEIKAGERDAAETFKDMLAEEWAQTTLEFLSEIQFRTGADILAYIKKINDANVATERLFSFIDILLRDVLCYKSIADQELLYGKETVDTVAKLARVLSYEKLGEAAEEMNRAVRGLRVNVNRDLQLENLFLRLREK